MDLAGVPGWKAAICALPALGAEEERELILRAQGGDERARRRVVESQLPTVLRYALKTSRYRVPVAELVAEGTIGVMEALDRFDVGRGLRFSTYAAQWMRNYVLKRIVVERAPYWSLRGAFRTKYWFRLRRELARAHNLGLPWDERVDMVAERLGLTRRQVEDLLVHLGSRGISFGPADQDDELTMESVLPSPEPHPEELAVARDERRWLEAQVASLLERLDDRDRDIVERRLMTDEPPTLAMLGREKHLSRERVRQLEERSRRKLARWLAPVREQL